MDKIEEMLSLLREIFIWIQEDNGHQARLTRFKKALDRGMPLTEDAIEALKTAFALLSHGAPGPETLRNRFDVAKIDLQQEIQLAEAKLAQLKGEPNEQDQEWVDQNF